MINLTFLSHFMVASEKLNISQAADCLFISQSTLSRQIQALETELGTALFIRNGTSLHLTPAGTFLYNNGQSLLSHAERITSMIQQQGEPHSELIRIQSISGFLSAFTEIRQKLKVLHPNAEIIIEELRGGNGHNNLLNGDIDFLVTYDLFVDNNLGFGSIPLIEEGFVLGCSPMHPFAVRECVTLSECMYETIIFGLDFPMKLIINHVNPNVNSVDSTVEFDTAKRNIPVESYFSKVANNEGIIILPENCGKSYSRDLVYIPICDKQLRHRISLFYRKGDIYSPHANAFLEIARRM